MKQLIVSKTLPGIRVTVLSYDDVYPPYQRGHRRHYKKGYWQLRIDVLEGHHPLRPGRTCYDLVRVHTSWRRKLADGLAVRQIALPDFAVLRVLKYQKHKSLNERPFLTIRLQNLQTGVAKHWKLSFPLTLVTA